MSVGGLAFARQGLFRLNTLINSVRVGTFSLTGVRQGARAPSTDILSLLKMTPYYWSTGIERLENITSKDELSVTCDFNIDIFKQK